MEKTDKKRILVMTSATGAGHDTHANATVAWCEQLYGSNVEVIVDHTLEDSSPIYSKAVDFYNFIQRKAPWFHHLYYNIIELLEVLNPGTVSLGRDYYIKLLERVQPHAVVSVMDCLNRGYFELARETLGAVKCATYCTEFSDGYGHSRNWVNPRTGYFFGRTEDTVRDALRRGVPEDRTRVVGHWAPPAFYADLPSAEEKAAYLKDVLQLDPDRFTLLLSTGGNAAQNHADILRTLTPLGDRIQVIALCGRDAKAKAELDEWIKREISFTVRTIPFTTEMPKLLGVASAVVARGGATTGGEALLCNCPVIFNGLGLMMPQELPTWRYFKTHDIGFRVFRAGGVRPIVERWLDHPDEYSQLRQRMLNLRNAATPQAALELLLA
jgi:processive 1,2-diacylglycerol beta-glucosyltransferase